jgi:uncharacterized protein YecE (DUF72 family)
MELFAGTSGFSYPEWRGPFYPAHLADAQLLPYYAARLRCVEINNTFYRMPRAEMLARWTEKVPASFRFVLKAPQQITHRSGLQGAAEAVEHLWRTASSLGRHLGPFLFQLPPTLRADVELLRRFLRELPEGCQAAFEFRHPSWSQPAVLDALRDAGCAQCGADSDPPEAPPRVPSGSTDDAAGGSTDASDILAPALVATADFGYLRLRRSTYSDAELDLWVHRIRSVGRAWREVYVFFKHEEAGAAPAMALRMNARFAAALPARRPDRQESPQWL